ncbi:MAG TPA: hypothetical protein PL124_11815, partial [Candidatus Cloacimonadota bacterium]|nr:hypothetical protein [Candidatus Cloacimonadota bacterium]
TSLRRNFSRPNPVIHGTCWLCHKVLGDDAYLYRLARGTHTVVCPKCAGMKIHQKNLEYTHQEKAS